tara:strand:- start:12314 stop:13264 length:951 start_codon:yes stop_codon:yes gene_type:complete
MIASCLVAMYHYVRDTAGTKHPSLNALAPCDFDKQLDTISQARHVVSYTDFERNVVERRSFSSQAALLTFDDGFVDHYEVVLPRLQARKMSGVFFLAGAPLDDPPKVLNVHKTHFLIEALGAGRLFEEIRRILDGRQVMVDANMSNLPHVYRYDALLRHTELKRLLNYELPYELLDLLLNELFEKYLGDESIFARRLYLSQDQIREMSNANMTFGFHTEQHRVLSRLPAVVQRKEIQQGCARIRALTDQTVVPFCYPYGHAHTYNSVTVDAVRAGGYSTAFTTARRLVDSVADDPLELPRYDTRDLPPFTESLPDA